VLGYDGTGTINIGGQDVELSLAGQKLPDSNFKVGRGGHQIWKGKETVVRLDYVFTWLCPATQENCSVYYYKGLLDVSHNKKRRKINVVGFGGS
jgi:hypothetical protein